MEDREIIAIVDAEFEAAMGAPDGEISTERALAWKYYNSEPLGNEIEGKSSYVTSDVADVVDGIMPSLMRMFSTKDNLVSFDAHGPEDEALAAQETDYTSYVFFKKNPGSFMTLYTWFFDALLQKNGIVKCWYDESDKITEETYKNLTEDEIFALLDDEELEPIEKEESTVYDGDSEVKLYDMKFKRTCKVNTIKVEPVPPEEYRITSDARCVDPSDARMVGQERDVKRSELIAMGFDEQTVLDLPTTTNVPYSEEELSRRDKEDDYSENYASDPLEESVEVRECYLKIDGVLMQVFTCNHVLLSAEPVDRQPFHVLSSKPLPHKHFGTCPGEQVMDIQKLATTLTRQMMDNIYQTNNPRNLIYEQAIGEDTMDGLLSTEIGGNVIVDRPIGEAWAPMTVPFTAGQSFPILEMLDKTKRDRTGVHSNAEGLEADSLKNIQGQVMREAVSMSKDKIEMIARIFAETGIKSLFLHIHELIRKYPNKAEVVKLRGTWVPVDPSSWRDRTDVSVNIGLGIGSKESNLLHLQMIAQTQKALEESGLKNLVVMPRNLYNLAREIAKNADQDDQLYFTDPGNELAPPVGQEAMQLQQQAQMLQMKEQELTRREQVIDKTMLQHQREMLKIEQSGQKITQADKQHDDKMDLEIQALRNEIAEMKLKYKEAPEGEELGFEYDPATNTLTPLT